MTQPAGPSPGPGMAPAALPGWLGPIVTVTTQVGVPTVVAAVLLWFVLFRVDGAMKVIQENEEERTRMVNAMQDTLIVAINRNTERLDRQTDKFVAAIDQNIAANQAIAAQLRAYLGPPAPAARTP
jgi:hypothetical protein